MDVIELYWPAGKPSDELEALVVEDLRREIFGDLKDGAEGLMVHMVPLGPIWGDNPCVEVTGHKGDHRFHCRYLTEWPSGLKFEIDDIPGFREKLKAAGHKFDDEEDT